MLFTLLAGAQVLRFLLRRLAHVRLGHISSFSQERPLSHHLACTRSFLNPVWGPNPAGSHQLRYKKNRDFEQYPYAKLKARGEQQSVLISILILEDEICDVSLRIIGTSNQQFAEKCLSLVVPFVLLGLPCLLLLEMLEPLLAWALAGLISFDPPSCPMASSGSVHRPLREPATAAPTNAATPPVLRNDSWPHWAQNSQISYNLGYRRALIGEAAKMLFNSHIRRLALAINLTPAFIVPRIAA